MTCDMINGRPQYIFMGFHINEDELAEMAREMGYKLVKKEEMKR